MGPSSSDILRLINFRDVQDFTKELEMSWTSGRTAGKTGRAWKWNGRQ
jgi:hypothetical protein